ncbi:MAG: SAM-dependent chlorinase/fluorinase [Verrucomicrobia bacterium]|nr:SAM-dependent chlorinase/fluorinase [Verrucomicrobiota bacterium]MBI3869019.1 SAM-dependent chlorinase/fluorinase [Verrucomicrobiota bacterium]
MPRSETTAGWITLTTDFGLEDWFVGTMKGVIARIAPKVRVVDLNHGIAPGDVRAGAFSLAAGFRFFPKGAIHIAIVDPGVGSARRALVARTASCLFIGPDNGVLSRVLSQESPIEVRCLENPKWRLNKVSKTFHGRDVFAPAAAHLAAGAPVSDAGPKVDCWAQLDIPTPRSRSHQVQGAVVYVDRYGNAITNIPNEGFLDPERPADVWVGEKRVTKVHEFYQSVAPGKAVCVPGSSGFLEIAVNSGDAAKRLKLKVGSEISVRW